VAAVRGVTSGTFETWVNKYEQTEYDDELLASLKLSLVDAKGRVLESIKFIKQKSTSYLDLMGRRLVDAAIDVIVGHLLLEQAVKNDRKKRVAKRFIQSRLPVLRMNCEQVLAGDTTPLDEYELLAGPVPTSA
jgi:hypothetical protein